MGLLAMLVGLWCLPVAGQFVAGDWVQRGEARIQKYRMTPVSFLVFDAQGNLAPKAEIHIEQLQHAFTVGFVIYDGYPEHYDAEAEGWRVFNAVSLEGITSWRKMQPTGPEGLLTESVGEAIKAARDAGMHVRWGALLSADAFDLPEWVVPLRGEALFESARQYLQQVAAAYGETLDDLDIAEETLDHDRLTPAMLRVLAMDAQNVWPGVASRLQYDDALSGPRTFDLVREMDSVIKQQLNIAGFTINQTFPPRPIQQDLMEPALQRLANQHQPLLIGSLEIAGSHAIETAVNTETVLRTLFAQPMVQGVYFSGLYADDTADPSAALFDDEHQPTPVSRTADRLFRDTWWTDVTVRSDELGQAKARVYLGSHRVTATLADGSSVSVTIDLSERRDDAPQIVLMPIAE
ncbi:hypothetical protein [Algisphaera agarilytica]|uniref:Uncharacterized protein n=1 Tax=Algisphaera agarilytica TaxID=1385975 RepID=A0A7X0H2V6_9BACT|nr:hypothetical protein [Algisphaera agarilytica]MBB6428231.1 hypothetical protein [Algisphaera agarilytica]